MGVSKIVAVLLVVASALAGKTRLSVTHAVQVQVQRIERFKN